MSVAETHIFCQNTEDGLVNGVFFIKSVNSNKFP